MTLDYIHNINAYGENIVRLYDFDMAQAIKFRDALQQSILANQKQLELAKLDFVIARNCSLILRIADEDVGLITEDHIHFYCDLTIKGFEQMYLLLAPFCLRETKGYQWLYDIDNETDFLFSPGGTW